MRRVPCHCSVAAAIQSVTALQHRAAAAALRVCLEHGELSVGGRAGADDGTAAVDLGGAAVINPCQKSI